MLDPPSMVKGIPASTFRARCKKETLRSYGITAGCAPDAEPGVLHGRDPVRIHRRADHNFNELA